MGRHDEARARFTGDKKQCTICNRWLAVNTVNFPPYEGGLGGVKATCRACYNATRRRGDNARDARRRAYTESHKQCSVCKHWKTHDKFHKNKKGLGGITACCKECVQKKNKRYRDKITGERWEKVLLSAKERRRTIRQEARTALMKDTREIITELDRRGFSRDQIAAMSGVTKEAMRRIMNKSRKYTWPATQAKLREALDAVTGMGE